MSDDTAPQPTQTDETQGPKGLRGWLIVLGIGVVFSPLRILAGISQIVAGFEVAYMRPGLNVALTLELLASIAFFLGGLYAAYLFFSKKAAFPQVEQALLLASIVVGILDAAIVAGLEIRMTPADAKDLARSFIAAAIWVPYLRMSKRVRNTFVEP